MQKNSHFDQIPALVYGALSTEIIESPKGIRICRLSPKQIKALEYTIRFQNRGYFPAGVVLRCVTSADWLSLDITCGAWARNYVRIDYRINGELHKGDFLNPVPSNHEFKFDLNGSSSSRKGQEKLLEIFLPHTCEITINDLSSNATLQPFVANHPGFSTRYLALGDSITKGSDAIGSSDTYANRLAQRFSWNYLNQAIGGHIFHPEYLDPDIDFEPDVITVAYGTNDWNSARTKVEFTQNCYGFLQNVHAAWPKARLFVLTPLWRVNEAELKVCGNLEILRDIIRECAQKVDAIIIEGHSLIKPGELNLLIDDGLHPNSEGHHIIAERLSEQL